MDFALQALLAPVSSESPAGPDLSDEEAYRALVQAARGKPGSQMGDSVKPAEEPDWDDVRQQAEALLARSKDLRVALLWTRALVRMHNAEGLAAGLELITGLLSQYWDTVHPQLDYEDHNDPTRRLNALAPLRDGETFLRDIRNASLVASPKHGRVTFRDILITSGKLTPVGDSGITKAEVMGALTAAAAEDPTPLQAAIRCGQSLSALESLLDEKGILGQAPEMTTLKNVLSAVAPVCAAVLSTPDEKAQTPEDSANTGGAVSIPGSIQSRDDAVRILETVCKYIERMEPSNPAPLLIRRAQRLIGRDFVEIIKELAPESLAEIQKLGGLDQKS